MEAFKLTYINYNINIMEFFRNIFMVSKFELQIVMGAENRIRR